MFWNCPGICTFALENVHRSYFKKTTNQQLSQFIGCAKTKCEKCWVYAISYSDLMYPVMQHRIQIQYIGLSPGLYQNQNQLVIGIKTSVPTCKKEKIADIIRKQ